MFYLVLIPLYVRTTLHTNLNLCFHFNFNIEPKHKLSNILKTSNKYSTKIFHINVQNLHTHVSLYTYICLNIIEVIRFITERYSFRLNIMAIFIQLKNDFEQCSLWINNNEKYENFLYSPKITSFIHLNARALKP